MKKVMILALGAILLLTDCGEGKAFYETNLNGYIGNKLRLKYREKVTEVTLDSGEPGYLITTDIRYSEGAKNRQGTLTKVWVKKDFALVKRENQIFDKGKVTSAQTTLVEGKTITFTDNKTGKDVTETIEWKHPHTLLGEVHPLLYSKELTNAGQSKPFWVFFEPLRDGAPVRVRNKGKSKVTLNGKAYDCVRYAVRSLQKAGAYIDYYIAEEDNRVMKVVMGDLEFVPPGTR